jgi:hypothetical protein
MVNSRVMMIMPLLPLPSMLLPRFGMCFMSFFCIVDIPMIYYIHWVTLLSHNNNRMYTVAGSSQS